MTPIGTAAPSSEPGSRVLLGHHAPPPPTTSPSSSYLCGDEHVTDVWFPVRLQRPFGLDPSTLLSLIIIAPQIPRRSLTVWEHSVDAFLTETTRDEIRERGHERECLERTLVFRWGFYRQDELKAPTRREVPVEAGSTCKARSQGGLGGFATSAPHDTPQQGTAAFPNVSAVRAARAADRNL